jgi:hypothetical protein
MTGGSPALQLASTRRKDAPLPPGAPWYKHLWRGWQKVARAFGNLLSRVVTSIMFVITTPFAIGVKLFADPLELKTRTPHWVPLPPQPPNVEEARKGF